MPLLHSGDKTDSPETTYRAPTPEVVWQQPQQTYLIDIHKNSITNINNYPYTQIQTEK